MADLIVTATSETSITVRWTNLDIKWSSGERYIYYYISKDGHSTDDEYYDGSDELDEGVSQSGTYRFRGLDPDTKYYITSYIERGDNGNTLVTKSLTEYTDAIVIDPWDWEATTATQKAYTALTTRGPLTDFSYSVWNDLVDKTYETVDFYGCGWLTQSENDSSLTYLTRANTKMTSSDKLMTADRFNSWKFQIGHIKESGGTGIQDVSPGDKIKGEYFITIAERLNKIIDYLM